MRFNSSSWFPLRNFTKSSCHFDWMLGVTKFKGVKDFLNPKKTITPMETVLWNRTLNANIALSTYNEMKNSTDETIKSKFHEIGLPLDVRV